MRISKNAAKLTMILDHLGRGIERGPNMGEGAGAGDFSESEADDCLFAWRGRAYCGFLTEDARRSPGSIPKACEDG